MWYWRTTNAVTAGTVWRAFESATEHLRLVYNGDGTFTFSRAGTTVGTTPTSANLGIVSNTWYHIEILARCHDTLGQYDVYVNGALACTGGGSALDTRNGGTAGTPNSCSLGQSGTAFGYDDFAQYRGTPMVQKGQARVITKLPTGDGANTGWTAVGAAADWQCVDENPNTGDTDYISSSTLNQRDSFTFPALGVTGTVLGVGVTMVARKDDAGARSIRGHTRVAATDYDGPADLTLATTYAVYQHLWETNPNTGVAWTVGGVDGAEFGVKLTA
jgi:hypothetical protein